MNLLKSWFSIKVLWVIYLFIPFLMISCQNDSNTDSSGRNVIDQINDSTSIVMENLGFFEKIKQSIDSWNPQKGIRQLNTYEINDSVLLAGKKRFAFTKEYEFLSGGEHFKAVVWRKGNEEKSALVVEGEKIVSLYIAQNESYYTDERGWQKLEVDFEVPPNITYIKIYVWNMNGDSVYFDDFKIEQLPPKEYPNYISEPKLHLYFSKGKMKDFDEKRMVAFEDGVHFGDEDWMKGVLSDEDQVMPIKARLKGDWLDHLIGEKWSFRVKMRDDFTFNRMRVFSLQNPITRYFLHEYVSHQLFDREDVLTTRYGFTPLYLNGKSLGYYAYEEHFAKQLLEYNLRREGPIVKFDEDPLWRVHQNLIIHQEWLRVPYYETSRILAFGMGRTLKNPALADQFYIAQSLMSQYKNHSAPLTEIFNVEQLAKYWALTDLINGRHGLAWHNQRMYYNPVLCKLEPINFDNFTDHYKDDEEPILSPSIMLNSDTWVNPENYLLNQTFASAELLHSYFEYIEKYTDENYLQAFLNDLDADITKYEELIHEEFPNYHFEPQYLLENARILRDRIPELKEKYENGAFQNRSLISNKIDADTTYLPKIFAQFVNTYYYAKEKNQAQVLIENYTGRRIEIIGLADKDNRLLYLFDDEMYLEPFQKQADDTSFSWSYNENVTQLAFRINEHEEIYYATVSNWRKNTELSPYQKLSREFNIDQCSLFSQKGDSLIVSGVHELREKVLIPKNKIVVFRPGSQLNLVNKSAFISHSPILMMGTEESPIHIYSADSSANSFTLLQAEGRSQLDHVIFKDLNTLSFDGWNLTGAVNFYESDVDIHNCQFLNNHCEDALNIIRSDFHVTGSSFEDIFADAFDSDFCTGLLDYSSFDRVGNDAIDFSTSQISIEHCEITNISDKGISGGEGSTLWVKNTNISKCNIGAASKDLSLVELEDVNIDGCYYGLVLLRKKPEYGPATLKTRKLKLTNCAIDDLVEKGSILYLNGRKREGTKEKVAEMFY